MAGKQRSEPDQWIELKEKGYRLLKPQFLLG